MPPSRHSSSSHSSRSSRSSGNSFRSSNSHSSSSRSSGRSSSSSSSHSSSFSGPSRHSSFSHSSRPASFGGFAAQQRPGRQPEPVYSPEPVHRPRVNQPIGFVVSSLMRPTYYYGRRHDYVYYPESWTDSESGQYYEKGYYDEAGKYYDSVAFQKNGKYENVVCHCPYCGSDRVLTLDNRVGSQQDLTCENCGGPMEIKSELDEITNNTIPNTHTYASEESLKNAFPEKKKKNRHIGLIILAGLLAIGIERGVANNIREYMSPSQNQQSQQISIVENSGNTNSTTSTISFGNEVFLEQQPDGTYRAVTDVIRANKVLYYDASADSYYDESTECWIWYNTDVEPPVWQYWYEGISSDYGDYGWMEHDSEGWWIEASESNWIQLPSKYDSSKLWYIQN